LIAKRRAGNYKKKGKNPAGDLHRVKSGTKICHGETGNRANPDEKRERRKKPCGKGISSRVRKSLGADVEN